MHFSQVYAAFFVRISYPPPAPAAPNDAEPSNTPIDNTGVSKKKVTRSYKYAYKFSKTT